MSLTEAPHASGITAESTEHVSPSQRRSASRSGSPESGQRRGSLLGKSGDGSETDVFNYRQQRLTAMRDDWRLLNAEFPGQFTNSHSGKPTEPKRCPSHRSSR